MNKVVDVTEAEELTGNPYSLAITTHEEVHFVKATSREETKWWMDVLSVFPRSKVRILCIIDLYIFFIFSYDNDKRFT